MQWLQITIYCHCLTVSVVKNSGVTSWVLLTHVLSWGYTQAVGWGHITWSLDWGWWMCFARGSLTGQCWPLAALLTCHGYQVTITYYLDPSTIYLSVLTTRQLHYSRQVMFITDQPYSVWEGHNPKRQESLGAVLMIGSHTFHSDVRTQYRQSQWGCQRDPTGRRDLENGQGWSRIVRF